MELTEHERQSVVAVKLRKFLEDNLANLRVRNDNATLGDAETAKLRGRIAETKMILAALETGPPPADG